jgi:hypothetical protein
MATSVATTVRSLFSKYTNVNLLDFDLYQETIQPSCIKTQLKPHQMLLIEKCLELEKNNIKLIKEDFNVNFKQLISVSEVLDTNFSSSTMNNKEISKMWKVIEDEEPDTNLPDRIVKVNNENKSFSIITRFGCICDNVGSGKTLTVLSILNEPINLNNLHSLGLISNSSLDFKISIIVVPHVISNQWKESVNKHTNLSFIEFREKDKNFVINNSLNYDFILIKNTEYKNFYKRYHNIIFKRAFFDEADSINIPNCNKIESLFYWFVTANYTNILKTKSKRYSSLFYNLQEKWRGISNNGFINDTFYLSPKILKQKLIFRNDPDFVETSFKLPDYNLKIIKCQVNNILKVLNGIVSDDVQRRICAGDIQGAIKSFNIESEDNENIIQVVCKDLYEKLEKAEEHLIEVKSEEAITNTINKIQKIKESIQNIKKNIEESELDPITYCEIENPVVMKCCKTVFDFESITMFITNKNSKGADALCPICRTSIQKNSMVLKTENNILNEEEKEMEEEWNFEEHTKDENIQQLFKQWNLTDEIKKIIIFSQFDASLNRLQFIESKDELNFEIKQIKGNNFVIKNTLDWFKSNDDEKHKVLFLNSRYCGAGLNLQIATDIIIYHSMEKNLENQVMGRAQRFPRESALNVYRFEE